jgi:Membrane proteins related to metalloendopeptidases
MTPASLVIKKIAVYLLTTKSGRKVLNTLVVTMIVILLLPVIIISVLNPFNNIDGVGTTDPYITAMNEVIEERNITSTNLSLISVKAIDLIVYGDVSVRKAEDIKKDIINYYLEEKQTDVEVCRIEFDENDMEIEVCRIIVVIEFVFANNTKMFQKLQQDKGLANQEIDEIKNILLLAEAAGMEVFPGKAIPTTSGYYLPTASGMVTCSYGCYDGHIGTDIGAPAGTDIYATASGTIIEMVNYCIEGDSSCGGAYGNNVKMLHNIEGKDVVTVYAHIQEGSIVVAIGQQLKAGDKIGGVGNTGRSFGNHLHFEILEGIDYFPGSKAERIRYVVDTEDVIQYPNNW